MLKKKFISFYVQYKRIFALAAPLILFNMLQNFYNLADTYFMGKLGGIELTTASFTTPITQMIIGIGSGFSIGGGIIISQLYGKKDLKKLLETSTQLLIINIILSTLIMFLAFIFCNNILEFSGATGELLAKSSIYIKFIFITIPLTFIVNTYTTINNCKGQTIAPLYIILYSVIANIILNAIFIYKFKMGLFGIGLATVIANIILSFYCLVELKRKKEIDFSYLKFKINIFFKILKLGIPISLSTATNSLSFVIVNIFVVKYGNEVLAAYGIGNRINGIIYVLINGIGSAIAILVGQNIGARKLKKAKAIVFHGMIIGIFLGILAIIFLYFTLENIIGTLTNDESIKYHTTNYVLIMLASIIPWVIFQVLSGVFQGTGHTKFNMYCHFGRVWFFRIPFIYFFEKILEAKEFSIWYSMLLSNLCALLFSFILYKNINWNKKI